MSPKSYLARLLQAAAKPLCCLSAALFGCQANAASTFIDGVGSSGSAPTLNDTRVVGDFDDDTTQGWTGVRMPGVSASGGVLNNADTDGLGSDGNGDSWIWLNTGSNNLFTVGELPGQYDIIQFDFRVDTPPPIDGGTGEIDSRIRGRNFVQGTAAGGGSLTHGVTYQPDSSFPIDNNWRTYTIVRDFNDAAWEGDINRLRFDLFDGIPNSEGGAAVLGAKFSVDNVILGRTTSTLAFPEITPVQPNMIRNGDLSQVSNAVYGSPDNDVSFNVNGGNGNYGPFRGNTGDVDDWTPFNNNPNSIVEAVNGPDGTGLNLLNADNGVQGSWYLDTHWSSTAEQFSLNTAGGYLNGLTQTDVLDGVTIDDSATYELSFDLNFNETRAANPNSNFKVALTVGDNSTDPGTAVAGSLFDDQLSNITSGDTQTLSITGAALKAAQDSGDPINLIVQTQANTSIVNFPGTPVPNNHVDVAVFTQVQVDNFSLVRAFVPQAGDLNKDGFLTTADLTLAQDYLAGNGGETAQKRQDDLFNAPSAPFEADILESLNLTDFDLTGDDYFDTADITALEALLPAPLDGDYNGDGNVDAADYTVWRDGGSPDSSQAGYDLWAANYGASQISSSFAAAVPEPTAVFLMGLAMIAVPTSRRGGA
ncbi:hypothetical protein MalM25_16870 [Planctomycetes bacterium MalM25]|nr:hypothetical protein MalM25_16870 [Planctomycetes bacterium MalM25]